MKNQKRNETMRKKWENGGKWKNKNKMGKIEKYLKLREKMKEMKK